MKLEYLDDISDGGKYKDVVSENLVRLYDFEQSETSQLVDLIYQSLIINNQSLDLATLNFIQPINCYMTLQLSPSDEGIIKTDTAHVFICKLTKETYKTAIEYMKAVGNGFNWFCDTTKDDIDFLYSAGGSW